LVRSTALPVLDDDFDAGEGADMEFEKLTYPLDDWP
jgi:hypothetical protein